MAALRNTAIKPIGSVGILAGAVICLLAAHLALRTFFPSISVNLLGLMIIGLVLFYVLYIRRDVFGFILIIYISSHFKFATNEAGLFNIVAFVLMGSYLLRYTVREVGTRDVTITILLWVLFIHNVLGWILVNPLPLSTVGIGAAGFCGYIFMFHTASNMEITKDRLRLFMIIVAVMVAYNFVISLNQHYSILKINTPLLGLREGLFYQASNAFGMFGSATLNGEYSMLMFALLVPMLRSTLIRRELRLSLPIYMVAALLCLATIILSNSRGSTILAVLLVVFYGFYFSVLQRRARGVLINLNIILLLCVVFLAVAGTYLGLSNLIGDFQAVGELSKESIISGKALNRFEIWQYGWNRLLAENWILGYGHGTQVSNWLAWGANPRAMGTEGFGEVHLHNLYMALPMLYGWIGACAFVLLFFVTIVRQLTAVRSYDSNHFLVAFSLGTMVMWLGFLAEEITSGVMVQEPHYPMIVWILLGLSNAAIRTLKAESRQGRKTAKAYHNIVQAKVGGSPDRSADPV